MPAPSTLGGQLLLEEPCTRYQASGGPRHILLPAHPSLWLPSLLQLATAVAMVGMTYAAVPLYRMFCQVR